MDSLLTGVVPARAIYMLILLVTAGTALFRVLVPIPERLDTDLRQVLKILPVAGVGAALVYWQLGGAAGAALGTSLAVAMLGFLLLWVCNWWAGPRWLVAGILALVISRALTGHPTEREPGWLLMPAMVMHVSCAAYWVGSMWPLHRALKCLDVTAAAEVVERFSQVAIVAVVTLAFIGLLSAQLYMGVLVALTGTWYGQLLIMKLTWFTVLMGFAAYHKLRLTPRLLSGDAAAAHRLRRTIRLEGAVMALVVLLSTLLAATPPE